MYIDYISCHFTENVQYFLPILGYSMCKIILSANSHNFTPPCLIWMPVFPYLIALVSTSQWKRHWYPAPVLLPGKSHGWRSLVGCSPWGHKESDMTERLHFHFSLSHIGEGNGNPLQCSCLENSRGGGAWWAAINGVTQSRTRLKWRSSSSKRNHKQYSLVVYQLCECLLTKF